MKHALLKQDDILYRENELLGINAPLDKEFNAVINAFEWGEALKNAGDDIPA